MTAGTALDATLTRPRYTLREAAAIVGVPPSTLHTWVRGRGYKGIDGTQQAVFRDVVEQYLRTITYRHGRIAIIGLPQFETDIVVDPLRNFGRPMLARHTIRVEDITGRIEAGEPLEEVALDFNLDPAEVHALVAA